MYFIFNRAAAREVGRVDSVFRGRFKLSQD